MEMGKYRKLIKNSAVFAIANIGSYLISFVLLRLYTELLTTEQYGIIDFLTVTVSLAIPVFTLSIVEAVFRFSMDDSNMEAVLANGVTVSVIGAVLFSAIGAGFFSYSQYGHYFGYLSFYFLACSINSICMQYARGVGKVTIFAISGIVKTFVLALSNILFLAVLHLKVEGYLLSLVISEAATIIYIFIAADLKKSLKYRVDKRLCKRMLGYSAPLIPNALSWWAMNAADKYVIFIFLGSASAGIYAVSHKIPTLINLCNRVFFQAWQLSAVEEVDNDNKSVFYSDVFNALAFILFLAASVLLLFLRLIMRILSSVEFSEAWRYTPFLVIGLVFSAFASFLGTNYVAMKKTRGAVKTTALGLLVNIALNLLLVQRFGMMGTSFATMVGFLLTWLYRVFDTRKFIKLKYDIPALLISITAINVQACMLIYKTSAHVYVGVIVCALIILSYRKESLRIIKSIATSFKR